MPINSKRKGKTGELEIARIMRDYGFDCRRTAQYCGNSEESADVVGLPGIHMEVKRVEKLNIDLAVLQAIRDSNKAQLPTVFHRKNNNRWLVTMTLDDWVILYSEYHSGVLMAKGCE